MIHHDSLQRGWKEISEKVRRHWVQLTNEDLHSFDGDVGHLVDLIQRKSGDARQIVEHYLNELIVNPGSAFERSAEEVREYAQKSRERIDEGTRQAVDLLRESRKMVKAYVQQHPAAVMGVCFGAGILAGLMLGLSTRRR
jgi:ElaB/YqjD/DUF883 family membrane-anchored ribosome-binding protein